MAHKKRRVFQHVMEDHSYEIIKRSLPQEWVIREFNRPDYGIDLVIELFEKIDEETSNLSDDEYRYLVELAKKHCFRGDVFQLVLSRRFEQKFKGDEFNVYRALRNINPSPYLFFFDYGDYKLMGSSPESQLIIQNHKAVIHPIAGTFRRTGDTEKDLQSVEILKKDPKENAEHTMLVDLARNDLSKLGKNVTVSKLKEIQLFSLLSEPV